MIQRVGLLLCFSLIGLLPSCAASKQMRYPATRWLQDNDRVPIKAPKVRKEYNIADGLQYQVFYQMERLVDIPLRAERALHTLGLNTLQEAYNTNNFDEVADSTWFTNRIGKKPLPMEELLAAGPKGNGPELQGPWTILRVKSAGITPGFLIEDARGTKFLIKFDPPDYPELTTAAEVITTRLIYAVGYNVAQTYLVEFSPSILKISEKLTKDPKDKNYFSQEKLTHFFTRVATPRDGKYRALASRYIEGDILGPFPVRGKRRGDKNDRIPHEQRRELRGYRFIAGFVGDADVREGNGLDTFIKTGPDNKGYVKHYLLDFGNSLGSATVKPKPKEHLYDYVLNYSKVLGSTVTFGGYRPKWEKAEDPGIPSVGLFESKRFKPEHWRPLYPFPAFQNTTDRDGFWATKILTQLSDEQIAAIVKEGRYSDPRAAPYVTKTLIERRNIIRDRWFSLMNPLDDFRLSENGAGLTVSFADLAVASGMRPAGSALYQYRLIQEKGGEEVLPWTQTASTSLPISQGFVARMQPGKFYLLQIKTKAPNQTEFGPLIDLILERNDQVQLLGLKRRYGS